MVISPLLCGLKVFSHRRRGSGISLSLGSVAVTAALPFLFFPQRNDSRFRGDFSSQPPSTSMVVFFFSYATGASLLFFSDRRIRPWRSCQVSLVFHLGPRGPSLGVTGKHHFLLPKEPQYGLCFPFFFEAESSRALPNPERTLSSSIDFKELGFSLPSPGAVADCSCSVPFFGPSRRFSLFPQPFSMSLREMVFHNENHHGLPFIPFPCASFFFLGGSTYRSPCFFCGNKYP